MRAPRTRESRSGPISDLGFRIADCWRDLSQRAQRARGIEVRLLGKLYRFVCRRSFRDLRVAFTDVRSPVAHLAEGRLAAKVFQPGLALRLGLLRQRQWAACTLCAADDGTSRLRPTERAAKLFARTRRRSSCCA